jgi:hypothetical protein
MGSPAPFRFGAGGFFMQRASLLAVADVIFPSGFGLDFLSSHKKFVALHRRHTHPPGPLPGSTARKDARLRGRGNIQRSTFNAERTSGSLYASHWMLGVDC